MLDPLDLTEWAASLVKPGDPSPRPDAGGAGPGPAANGDGADHPTAHGRPSPASGQEITPGDDYNVRATWEEILEPAGWRKAGPSEGDGEQKWTRPGKDSGYSATTGHGGHDLLHVFSDNAAPFESGGNYDKFGAFARLNHKGDCSAAAKDLYTCGYGSRGKPKQNGHVNGHAVGPVLSLGPDAGGGESVLVPGTEDSPHWLARGFLADQYRHRDGDLLKFWDGQFWSWNGSSYQPVPQTEMRADLSRWIGEQYDLIYGLDLARAAMSARDGKPTKAARLRPVTRRGVIDAEMALSSLTKLSTDDCSTPPRWLGTAPNGWAADEMLPTLKTLVHLPSFVAGRAATMPATPNLFTTYSLDFDWQADPPFPVEWHKFLQSIWPDDQESMDTLAEWFGYCLLPDTSQQKILFLKGAMRSGKGTIAYILRRLIGDVNVAAPTLSSLANDRFGITPLIGKTAAIISDARLSGRVDIATIAERLLSISGEDTLTVDRKFIAAWTGQLRTRITVLSNELPRLNDASGALASRFILLKLTRSFLGSEDYGLRGRLSPELPGILHWAIDGWQRLTDRGHFAQPASGKDELDQLMSLTSPTLAFIEDECIVGDEHECKISVLFQRWQRWCEKRNQKEAGNEMTFGRNMHAALPRLIVRKRLIEGDRAKYYVGVDVLPENVY